MLLKRSSVGASACLNSFKTTERTGIKLGMIDHHPGGEWHKRDSRRYDNFKIKDNVLKFSFLDQGNGFWVKRKPLPVPYLPTLANFTS